MKPNQNDILKRLLDIVTSVAGLIFLSPVYLVLGLVIYFKLGLPIIFKQKRPGLHGEPFIMYKFRSMTNERDDQGNLLDNEERLTPFGKKLRSTSLDELPELVNVLKGDMSLVGPRPLKMEYLPRYSEEQARRHEVRPGVTGWAQVNGRNAVSWEKRFEMDVWYVDHHSLWLDIKIIAKTLNIVLTKQGVSPGGDKVITVPFQGSDNNEQ
ncbi:sugar transferase [Aliifodinibius salicampi]|uniref:Sugar transferase n=1 Tax=Fodinibius salicampi TaxID=1920655 RepID=A0ABT3PYS1_9BACT|nr:sugar transferase [Fodinibius salicampi]MCW9712992.1 sugar transferase [Fodinibius salicampi]